MLYISLVWHFYHDKRTKCNYININTSIIENPSQFVLIELLSKCLQIRLAKFGQKAEIWLLISRSIGKCFVWATGVGVYAQVHFWGVHSLYYCET
jgi:hypothetical protein